MITLISPPNIDWSFQLGVVERGQQCSVLINRTWPQTETEQAKDNSNTTNFQITEGPGKNDGRFEMWDIVVQRIKYKAKSSL